MKIKVSIYIILTFLNKFLYNGIGMIMEIIKFKKNKDNTYMVIFDNNLSLKLYDDVIVKYNLLSNKILNDQMLTEISDYNDYLLGYYKAIKYIMKKLRSEKEVRIFLEKLEIKKSDIDKLILKLRNDGYINENNYLKAYINDQINLSLTGPDKIKDNLKKLGFSDEDIDNYLIEFDAIWVGRIEKIISKKLKLNRNLGKNKLKLKIINDLVNMGYKKYDIISVLDSVHLDDKDILLKEYQKALRKFEAKFKDNLEYKVRDYLYKKGFDLNEIERVMNNE